MPKRYLTPGTIGPRRISSGAVQVSLLLGRGAGPRAPASDAPHIPGRLLPHRRESSPSAVPTLGRWYM